MTERQFQTCLQDGARSVGWHVTPIPDGGQATRFSAPRVYDLILSWDGIGHHVELKKLSGKRGTWPIKDLKPHQEENLLDAVRVGKMGWVIVLFQVQVGKKRRKTERWKDTDLWEAVYGAQIGDVVDERDMNFLTGLDLDWWVDNGVFLPELPHGYTPEGNKLRMWDPSPLAKFTRTIGV